MQHLIGEEKERTLVRAVLSLFLLVTKRLYGKEWEWSIGQIKTCRKKQHVEIDDRKEMPDLFCGKAAVGGNYNLMRDIQVLQKEYREISEKYRKESLKSKTQQRAAAHKFRWFYEKCRTELIFIEPDIDKLIDMLVMIYYGDKSNGSDFLGVEKDILWNAFPEEMIARCSQKDISTEIDYEKLKERHKKNVEVAKKKRDKKSNKLAITINSIDGVEQYRQQCVVITKEDRKYINAIINDAFKKKLIKRSNNVIKLKRILTVLVFLNRKCVDDNGDLQWIKKMCNAPNEITDNTLEKLTGVNHKYMDTALVIFEKIGVVQTKIYRGGTKIKVLIPYQYGEVWINTEDYNKAGTMIRDYFRTNMTIEKQIS